MVLPNLSVNVITVLLNVAFINAIPSESTLAFFLMSYFSQYYLLFLPFYTPFLPATVFFLPFLVLELFLVFCPLEGKPFLCLIPL